MTASFVSTAFDKVKKVDVARQTGYVIADTKQMAKELNFLSLLKQIKKDPRNLIDILNRLQYTRITTPKSLLEQLRRALNNDKDYLQYDALNRVQSRLSRLMSDKTLIGTMSVNDIQGLLNDMGSLKSNRSSINIRLDESTLRTYGYSSTNVDDVLKMYDLYTSLNPEANVTVIDGDSLYAINKDILQTAVTISAEQIILDTLAKIQDVGIKRALLGDVITKAVSIGNTALLANMLSNSLYGVTASDIVANNPSWVVQILSAYQIPAGTTLLQALTDLKALLDALSAVDPNGVWWKYNRNGTSIPRLDVFQIASGDARKLFMTDSALRIPLMLADTYQAKTSMVGLAREFYPLALI